MPLASDMRPAEPPLWAIVGPTAAGKSRLALALAERLGAEIISCDAVQVYRGCNIGSAKPTAQERARVPHHLVDCTEPGAPFDAKLFVAAAQQAIADIQGRGRVPLLCGGTGMYLRALRLGLIDVPQDSALRAELEAADAQDTGSSLRRLAALDPQSAATIDNANPHYVRRALEITLLSGRPASAVRAEHAARAVKRPMVLWWVDRTDEDLRQRIDVRTRAMLQGGLVAEVEGLLRLGVPAACNALRSVGYREVVAMVQGHLPVTALTSAIRKSTWAYVRRQRIWLRREQRHTQDLVRHLLLQQENDTAVVQHLAQQFSRQPPLDMAHVAAVMTTS